MFKGFKTEIKGSPHAVVSAVLRHGRENPEKLAVALKQRVQNAVGRKHSNSLPCVGRTGLNAAIGQHSALWLSGRPGGEDDFRQVIGRRHRASLLGAGVLQRHRAQFPHGNFDAAPVLELRVRNHRLGLHDFQQIRPRRFPRGLVRCYGRHTQKLRRERGNDVFGFGNRRN